MDWDDDDALDNEGADLRATLSAGLDIPAPTAGRSDAAPAATEPADEEAEAAADVALDEVIRQRTEGDLTPDQLRERYEDAQREKDLEAFKQFIREDHAARQAQREAARAMLEHGHVEPEPEPPTVFEVMSDADFQKLLAAREAGLDAMPTDMTALELSHLYNTLNTPPPPVADPYDDDAANWDMGL